MEVQSTEHANPFSMFEMSQVCATCTKHVTKDGSYSLNPLKDPAANVNLCHVLESLFQFKCEENGPSNICSVCYSLTLLVYEFHQQCKHSVMLFKKHIDYQKQFTTPEDNDIDICDTDATSTITVEEPDIKLTIEVEETCITGCESTLEKTEYEFNVLDECLGETIENDISCSNDTTNKQSIPPPIKELRKYNKTKKCMTKLRTTKKTKAKKKKLYECTLCDAVYHKYTSLQWHSNIHKRRYVCSYCDKAFGSKTALKHHVEGQHSSGKRLYECNECGRGFNLIYNLAAHKRNVHSTKEPFECKVCQKTYVTIGKLRRHEQIHTGIKQYMCMECNMSFIFAYDLTKHLQRKHKIEEIPIQET